MSDTDWKLPLASIAENASIFFTTLAPQLGSALVRSAKFGLPKEYDADEVAEQIVTLNIGLKAHSKPAKTGPSTLAVGYLHYEVPATMSTHKSVESVASDVIELFRNQKQEKDGIILISIKILLPDWCNADEVAKYINANHIQYAAHSKKDSKEGPTIVIEDAS